MKFFAPVVLALAAAPALVTASIVDTCYINAAGDVMEDEVLVTMHGGTIESWYGYSPINTDTLNSHSANTPPNVEGLANEGAMGFIPVKVSGGIGLAMIMDSPDDPDAGNPLAGHVVTKLTCTPEGPGDSCGSFPSTDFLTVTDDDINDSGDKYASSGGAIYIGHRWLDCCTDGFATQPLNTCVEICVEVIDPSAIPADIPTSGDNSISNARRKSPLGLSKVQAFSDAGGGASSILPLKEGAVTAPVVGDKFCFKTCGGTTGGDPHFKTFGAKWYDFMGACDLVLMDAPNFTPAAGLRVDIRTAIRYAYSYIESAVIALGEDIFEVSSFGQYAINGVSNAELPATLNGFSITHTQPSDKVHVFQVSFSDHEHLIIKTLKDMVSVKWGMILGDRFKGARGMLGDAENGKMLGRNGTVTFEDPIEFAAEWQVREDEAMNFMVSRAPQYPAQCILPEVNAATQRRLGETATIEAAEKACANWAPEMRAACVHDVIATGDLELAEAGAF